MTFKKILVALDGSKNSQIAADYAFWLASELDAELSGINVVDPHLIDLFLEREFGEELGLAATEATAGKVMIGLKKIGKSILDLFAQEAKSKNLSVSTILAEGYIVEELLKREKDFDLLIMGHRGKRLRQMPGELILGSVAERLIFNGDMPVLVAVQPLSKIEEIVVAYDGSEPARGALLLAENLAKSIRKSLNVITVIPNDASKCENGILASEVESYLREYWPENVIRTTNGLLANTLLEKVAANSLIVLGAYGFKDQDRNILGSSTSAIRQTKNSLLVYRPNLVKSRLEAVKGRKIEVGQASNICA